jgi:hypothetical protein
MQDGLSFISALRTSGHPGGPQLADALQALMVQRKDGLPYINSLVVFMYEEGDSIDHHFDRPSVNTMCRNIYSATCDDSGLSVDTKAGTQKYSVAFPSSAFYGGPFAAFAGKKSPEIARNAKHGINTERDPNTKRRISIAFSGSLGKD